MKRFGFFNSINGDRKYLASDISNAFNIALGSGLQPIKDCFKIVPHENMKLKMKPGGAMIYGCYIFDEEYEVIELGTAHSELNRIDRIVLRYDKFERSIKTVVIKGTPALSPTAPATLRTDNQFDLVLADIKVGKAVTEIKQENITDMRSSMFCGFLGMKMTPEIEKQLDSKASKDIYGDGGVVKTHSFRILNQEVTSSLFRMYHEKTKHTTQISCNGGFTNFQCGGNNGDESNGLVTISGINGKDLKSFYIKSYGVTLNGILAHAFWGILRDESKAGLVIRNKKTNKELLLKDDGTIAYDGKKLVTPQGPSFERSVALDKNKTVTVTHNLGYKPITEIGTTLGNVNVTWQHIDNNTIKLYNYSTNEANVVIRCW